MPPPSSGRGIVLRFGTQDAEKVTQALLNLAASGEQAATRVVAANDKQAASTAGYERSLAALQRRLDPLASAERDLARATDAHTQAQRAGTSQMEQYDRVVAAATRRVEQLRAAERAASTQSGAGPQGVAQAYQAQADLVARAQRQMAVAVAGTQESVKRAFAASTAHVGLLTAATKEGAAAQAAVGQQISLTTHQLQNLGFQVNDVVVGLLSGQQAWRVMVQQGPQISQVLGGWTVAFRALTNPITLAVAGMAALGVGVGVVIGRAIELERQLRALKISIDATGGASGLSAASAQNQVLAFARQPGVDRATAQDAARQILQNPLINGDMFARVLPLARDFAAITGTEIPAAAKALATALTGGYQAALQLDRQFHLLSDSELKLIRTLDEQGRTTESAGIMLAAVERRAKGAADLGVLPLDKAAKDLTNTWNTMLDSMAKGDAFAAAKKYMIELLDVASGKTSGAGPGGGLATLTLSLTTQLSGTLARLLKATPPVDLTPLRALDYFGEDPGKIESDAGRIAVAMQQIGVSAGQNAGALHAEATAVRALLETLDPAAREMQRLENEQVRLTNAMANGLIGLDLYAAGMANLGRAMANVQTPENVLARLREEASLAGQRPAARAAGQERLRLSTQPGWTQAQIDEAATLRGRIAGAGGGAGIADKLKSLDLEAAGAERVARAYAQSEEAGRRAELALRAQTQHHKDGAAAVDAFARALTAEDTARRKIEGAKQLRALEDEVADQDKLTAALVESTVAYEKQKIAIDAARRSRQGFDTTPEDTARFVAAETRKLEDRSRQEAIGLNRQLDPVASFNDTMARLEKLEKTGLLTARALTAAWENEYIKMGRAGDSWIDGAVAGLLEYARQARNVGGQVADTFTRGFATIQENFARSMVGMAVDWRQFWQNLKLDGARILVGQMLSPIAGGLGGLLGGAGIGGAGTQTITINGQPVTIGGGGGVGGGGLSQLFGNLFGGGSGGLLGGGSGGFLGGIGAWLNQPLGISLSSGMGPVTADALSGFGSLTGMNVLGGLGGLASGIFGLASGNPIGGIAGLLGGALSFIPGLGGLGSVIGLIGGLLGGVLKKKPKTPQAVSNLEFIDGAWETSTAMKRSKQGSQLAQGTGKAGGAVGDIIDELAAIYGLGLGTGTTGGFLINSIGKNTGNLWQVGLGTYAAPQQLPAGFQNGGSTVTAAYTSPDDAVSALAAMIVRAGAAAGTLTGLTATERTVLRDEDITTIDAIKKALDFSDVYDKLVRGAENITAAETAVEDLNKQFRSLSVQAKSYGLEVAVIEQRRQEAINKLATDVNESSRRRILALTPEGQLQLALEDADKARDEAVKNARFLNTTVTGTLANINKLEEAYAKERLEIIENANAAATANLEQIWKRLSYGDLSGASAPAMLAGATATADSLYAQAQAGSLTARADLGDAVNDLFMAQLANTGNNSVYEALRQLWLGRLGEMVSANTDTVSPANGNVDNSLLAQTQAMVDQLGQQVTTLVGTVQDQSREIARLLARL